MDEYTLERLDDTKRLLDYEWDEYRALFDRWDAAKSSKDWAVADALREEVHQWQRHKPDKYYFHQFFEERQHTGKRAIERMRRYPQIESIHPWTREDMKII